MLSKFIKVVMLTVLALTFSTMYTAEADAAAVMWGKTELKVGQIGKVTLLKNSTLWTIQSDGSLLPNRSLEKGEEFRVYSYKSNQGGLYGLGGGKFVKKDSDVQYETPSKSKLALLGLGANNTKPSEQPKPSEQQPTNKNSRSNPAKIGEVLTVENNHYRDGYSKYEIELKQVIHGEEAWKIIKEGNKFNSPPKTGMKYVLAKFRVKVLELDTEPLKTTNVGFSLISKNGVKYTDFATLALSESNFRTELYKGAEHEGWTYFMVNEGDKPLAVYHQGSDDETWFDIN